MKFGPAVEFEDLSAAQVRGVLLTLVCAVLWIHRPWDYTLHWFDYLHMDPCLVRVGDPHCTFWNAWNTPGDTWHLLLHLILAGSRRLFGDVAWPAMLVLSAVFLSALGLVYGLAKRLGGSRRAACMAVVFWGLHPSFFYIWHLATYVVMALRILAVLGVCFFVVGRQWTLATLCLVLGLFCRSEVLLAIPLALVTWYWKHPGVDRARDRALWLWCTGACVVAGGLMLRNFSQDYIGYQLDFSLQSMGDNLLVNFYWAAQDWLKPLQVLWREVGAGVGGQGGSGLKFSTGSGRILWVLMLACGLGAVGWWWHRRRQEITFSRHARFALLWLFLGGAWLLLLGGRAEEHRQLEALVGPLLGLSFAAEKTLRRYCRSPTAGWAVMVGVLVLQVLLAAHGEAFTRQFHVTSRVERAQGAFMRQLQVLLPRAPPRTALVLASDDCDLYTASPEWGVAVHYRSNQVPLYWERPQRCNRADKGSVFELEPRGDPRRGLSNLYGVEMERVHWLCFERATHQLREVDEVGFRACATRLLGN